jgi:hypothetical protein
MEVTGVDAGARPGHVRTALRPETLERRPPVTLDDSRTPEIYTARVASARHEAWLRQPPHIHTRNTEQTGTPTAMPTASRTQDANKRQGGPTVAQRQRTSSLKSQDSLYCACR